MGRVFSSLILSLAVILTGCNSIEIQVNDLSPVATATPAATATPVPTATPSAFPADAAHSSLSVGAGTADNSGAITVTITLKDSSNNPVVGTTPTIEIVNSAGTYTVSSACTYSDTSGISTCQYKTFRGGQQIVRMVTPAALTSVGAVANPACAAASVFFTGAGSGTSGDPYQISTLAQFDQIRCLSSYFKLTADIDLSGIGWFPAQVDRSPAINGQNHVIANLTIDIDFDVYNTYGLTSMVGASLLGSNNYDGTAVREIKNITFTHPTVYARGALSNLGMDAGIIATKTNHRISYITVTNGIVSGSGAVGGLVSYLGSAQVGSGTLLEALAEHNSFSGTVSYRSTTANGGNVKVAVGGIVGKMGRAGASISNNTFSGTVDATTSSGNDAGGILGVSEIEDTNTGEKIAVDSNQVTSATISSAYFAGGVVGYLSAFPTWRQSAQPSVSLNFVNGSSISSGANAGGIAGAFSERYGGSHLNLYPLISQNAVIGGSVGAGSALVGGLVGFMGIGSITNSYVRGTVINAANQYTGGLVGGVTQSDINATSIVCEMKSSYAAVTFSNVNSFYAAIIGNRTDGTLSMDVSSADVYYDADLAGSVTETAPLLANGYSSANMKTSTPFSGWSTGVWSFVNGSYPRLISNANP